MWQTFVQLLMRVKFLCSWYQNPLSSIWAHTKHSFLFSSFAFSHFCDFFIIFLAIKNILFCACGLWVPFLRMDSHQFHIQESIVHCYVHVPHGLQLVPWNERQLNTNANWYMYHCSWVSVFSTVSWGTKYSCLRACLLACYDGTWVVSSHFFGLVEILFDFWVLCKALIHSRGQGFLGEMFGLHLAGSSFIFLGKLILSVRPSYIEPDHYHFVYQKEKKKTFL